MTNVILTNTNLEDEIKTIKALEAKLNQRLCFWLL